MNVDTIRMEIHVQHVEQRNIVVHDQQAVVQQMYDIMRIHHVVRQHVQMVQQIHTIQVMHQQIAVAGSVMMDMNKIEQSVKK